MSEVIYTQGQEKIKCTQFILIFHIMNTELSNKFYNIGNPIWNTSADVSKPWSRAASTIVSVDHTIDGHRNI